MKLGRLSTFTGIAIVVSSSMLFVGASVATAAVVPANTDIEVTISVPGCANGTIDEDRDSNGAFVDLLLASDTCGIGFEAGIKGPNGTPICWGGDVKHAGDHSVTCHIPINSGNDHGFRYWLNNQWNPVWPD